MVDYQTLRNRLDQELRANSLAEARQTLGELWSSQPSSSTAALILNLRPVLAKQFSLRQFRVAILRSFTVEPIATLLQASAVLHGLDLDIYFGDFNAYAQEMLQPPSALRSFDPAIVILAVRTPDLLPLIWEQFPDLAPEDVPALISNALQQMRTWLQSFRQSCGARLIVHSLELPVSPAQGLLDHANLSGQTEAILEFNRGLKTLAAEFTNVSVLDYDALISRYGREPWNDEVRSAAIRLPISSKYLRCLAHEWLRHIHAFVGQTRKVLVTDLDNTLWGGLAGEEGLSGIQLGTDHAGLGYRKLQRALLDLHHRGILLAVCSKNNEADAMRILEQHPDMLLKPDHFAAMRINWNDKAANLKEIAAELNLGNDALVFLDDNPVERQRIRAEMPEVEVIELPSSPLLYAQALRDSVVFERLSVTAEDRLRTELYRQQKERIELAQAAGSLEEFYASLKQVVTIAPVTAASVSRAAQLTQKTNQFNLTTRRYSETQISELMATPGWNLSTIQVEDRFGDNGIVGVVITHTADYVCCVDTFVLSCRVIGRTVESAVLSYIVAECAREGLQEIRGQFIPTKKNAPAASLYSSHGFVAIPPLAGGNGNGEAKGSWWALDLRKADVKSPEWIQLRVATEQVLSTYATR